MRRSLVAMSSVATVAVASGLALPPLSIWPSSEAAAQTCVSRPEAGLWSGTWSSTKIAGERGTFAGFLRFGRRVAPYSVRGSITTVDTGVFSFTSAANGIITCTGGWSVPIQTPVGVESYTGSESGGTTASGTFAAPSINDAGVWSGGVVPVVTKLSPRIGPTTGGNMVRVKGSGLENGTVDFGSHPATIVGISPKFKTITVTAPPGAGTVDVTVTTPNGTSTTSPADQYTYR